LASCLSTKGLQAVGSTEANFPIEKPWENFNYFKGSHYVPCIIHFELVNDFEKQIVCMMMINWCFVCSQNVQELWLDVAKPLGLSIVNKPSKSGEDDPTPSKCS
jgi:hypothetical protein